MVRNYMEEIIDDMLPLVLDKYTDICKCEKCIEDVKALALNNFKPLYVSSEKGVLYSKINKLTFQFKTDVLNQLVQAVDKVSKNPNHNV